MNIFEQFMSVATNHNEKVTAVRNATQHKLAEEMGVELGIWIDMGYAKRFDEITKANPTILEDLLNKDTHDKTFEEIKTKIYN